MKNKKIITGIIVIILLALGGYLSYYLKNRGNEKKAESTGVFTLLDDEKNLVYSEQTNVMPQARTQFEQKAKEAEELIKKGGDNEIMVVNYNDYALYNAYLGQYKKSYDAYLKSVALNDMLRATWMGFGDLLVKMKAYKSAEFAYNKIIEINPWEPLHYIKLLDLYKASGETEKIAETYKIGLEKTSTNIEGNTLLLARYAQWLEEQKSYDEAIKVYNELIKAQPDNKAAIEKKIEKINNLKQ